MTVGVSVIMSVYNDAAYLPQAVDSILGQTMGAFEFLIVDDGSTDGSTEILADFARRDPRIKLLRQSNRGLPASLNRLIDAARAPLIARMDGDDVSLPDRLERQVAFLRDHPDHGVVGTQMIAIDPDNTPIPRCEVVYPLAHEALTAAGPTGPLFCHPSVMMRRDVLRSVGGYRPAYRHCEDYDLWLRLMPLTRMANLSDRLLCYRRSAGQVTNRHRVEMLYGAYVANLAYRTTLAGHADPTAGLAALPSPEELDALFPGRHATSGAHACIAAGIRYDPDALAGNGLPAMLSYLRETHRDRTERMPGLWKAALRLVRTGHVAAPVQLGLALLRP